MGAIASDASAYRSARKTAEVFTASTLPTLSTEKYLIRCPARTVGFFLALYREDALGRVEWVDADRVVGRGHTGADVGRLQLDRYRSGVPASGDVVRRRRSDPIDFGPGRGPDRLHVARSVDREVLDLLTVRQDGLVRRVVDRRRGRRTRRIGPDRVIRVRDARTSRRRSPSASPPPDARPSRPAHCPSSPVGSDRLWPRSRS